MNFKSLLTLCFSGNEILHIRDLIRNELIKSSKNIADDGNINKMTGEDLNNLFKLYDKYFFKDCFKENFKNSISFSLSNRMSSNAGKTIMIRKSQALYFEIVIALKFFANYSFSKREKKVNGIVTCDALNALQIVFEHELCHLIEFCIYGESSCKKSRFKSMAFSLFRHTDVYHELPTERELIGSLYNVKRGDNVTFSYNGITYCGIVNSINKKASVMVKSPSGSYIDKYGTRYVKYYVPLNLLKQNVIK